MANFSAWVVLDMVASIVIQRPKRRPTTNSSDPWVSKSSTNRSLGASIAALRAALHLREPPPQTDEEEPPIFHEFRRLALVGVAHELQEPADREEHDGNGAPRRQKHEGGED